MNKALLATSLLCAAAGVTACSPLGLDTAGADRADAATASEELPPGFYLGGEFVELGPFDPQDSSIDPIRACEEIPEEVFEAAGLRQDLGGQEVYFEMTSCSFSIDSPGYDDALATIVSGTTTTDELISKSHYSKIAPDSEIPGLVQFELPDDENRACRTSIDTSRGLFHVVIDDFTQGLSRKELCDKSVFIHTNLYQSLRGEQNDTQH